MVKLNNEEIDWLRAAYRKTAYNQTALTSITALERVAIMVEETGLNEEKVRAFLLNEFEFSEPIIEKKVSIEITFSANMEVTIDRTEQTEYEFIEEMTDKFYDWFSVNHDISVKKMSDVGEDLARMDIEDIDITYDK